MGSDKDVLYKYVKADLVGTCLPQAGDGTLRATQPGALNDPFECVVIPGNRRVLHAPNDEIATLLTTINGTTPVNPEDVEKAKGKHGSLYLRELLTKQLSQRFGIVSFASDPLHPLMWAHYTGDGSGFVIGYDSSRIAQLTRRTDCLKAVIYQTNPLVLVVYDVLNETRVNTILSIKSEHWNYEGEWRLIVELNETIGTGKVDHFGYSINLLRVPNEAVVSVHYTERTPRECVGSVIERLSNPNNRYGVTSPTQLVLSSSGYAYEAALESE